MLKEEYHFITRWRLESTAEEIYEILENATDLTRWWPSVYLEVEELFKGDKNGVGKQVRLLTKGWLPYRLKWKFICTEANKPNGFSLKASGDFKGQGIWKFQQEGQYVNITYDWKVRADKPLLRYLSFMFKPVFEANHGWAMKNGEESLRNEIARRKANKTKR